MSERFVDPLAFVELCWPGVTLYDKQRQILYSVRDNDETVVPAGNALGKDFVSGLAVLWMFLRSVRQHTTCRIVTTSAKDEHLSVLWGEIGRFIQTSRIALATTDGGPIICNHRLLRRLVNGIECPISYVKGMVAGQDSIASMGGHHAYHTMFVSDESSSVPDRYYEQIVPWAKRVLSIGNTWACENFFKYAVKGRPGSDDKGGDRPDPNRPNRFYRKVIKIRGIDSPNVRAAHAYLAKFGDTDLNRRAVLMEMKPLIPGVLTYEDYLKRRSEWPAERQCVSLDAEWYEGVENRLYPPDWLDRAEEVAVGLNPRRRAKAIGVDPGEGGDPTCMVAVDDTGVIALDSRKTPDTSEVTRNVLGFAREHGVEMWNVCFDRGGGGKEHADRLRAMGHMVRTVAFGETATDEATRWKKLRTVRDRKDDVEERFAFKNRRAEMYWLVRELLDPSLNARGFGIPREMSELRRQLSVMPLKYDEEGRIYLPPKNRRNENQREPALCDILGCSPDEADALVVAVFCMMVKSQRPVAGAI